MYALREKQSIVSELASASSVAADFSFLKAKGKKCYLLRKNLVFKNELEHDKRILFELLAVATKEEIMKNRNEDNTDSSADEVASPMKAEETDSSADKVASPMKAEETDSSADEVASPIKAEETDSSAESCVKKKARQQSIQE